MPLFVLCTVEEVHTHDEYLLCLYSSICFSRVEVVGYTSLRGVECKDCAHILAAMCSFDGTYSCTQPYASRRQLNEIVIVAIIGKDRLE